MSMVLAIAALFVAFVAIASARRSARQVERLTEMYWQLKYEHGELKATLVPPPEAPPAAPSSAFVPLGAVKRRSS